MFSSLTNLWTSKPVDLHVHNSMGDAFYVNYYPPAGLPYKNYLHLIGTYHDITATFSHILARGYSLP
ncbi:uncharacterized protein PHACADRAFT_203050 [Phanerochaete carnosa HHB-10118-sp]|uniref:Uncharacterized protein n=1 Tax=Phanerochaete carnosa (strain HHB-10118-sp) TaxID=650164 RepID=K5VAZ6_PHACS|nr:uncharacterized protein PHACADRAFT_203050 [Phanerochaete carnosa HHB-10118-sp]EKM48248.1 hypothetical protein PHACADRAFT_203050 [Phanerochaete carnosa HHB-10118-sp]